VSEEITVDQLRPKPKSEFQFEESGNKAFATSVLAGVRSVDDLLNFAKVDRDLWEVERYTINKWDMGYKDDSKAARSHPLYQVKVWLKKRVVVEQTRQIILDMLAEFRKQAPKQKAVKHARRDGHLLEISIFDLHVGKLCWAPEVGENYDVNIAKSVF
jgi:hypothetical protein